jgi:hypothetical protein
VLLHYTPLIVSGVTCIVLCVQAALVLLLLGLVATRRSTQANVPAKPAETLPGVYVLSFMLVVVSDEDNKRAPESERIGTGILKYGFKFLTCVDGTIDMVAILHRILEAYNASEIVILSLNPLPAGMRYNLPAQNIVDTRTLK